MNAFDLLCHYFVSSDLSAQRQMSELINTFEGGTMDHFIILRKLQVTSIFTYLLFYVCKKNKDKLSLESVVKARLLPERVICLAKFVEANPAM